MGQGLFYEKPWVVISPTLTSLGVMVSCYPDTQVGGNWAAGGGGEGGRLHMLHQADGSPVSCGAVAR